MTTFGLAPLSSIVATRFVEATEASLLQGLLAAQLTDLADNVDGNVTGVNLAGAGDGYSFVAEIDVSDDPPGSAFEAGSMRLACYSASSAEELAVARVPVVAALLAEDPPVVNQVLNIVDEQVVGASKGTRFMGMIVAVWISPD